MSLVDSHCHLDDEQFDPDRDAGDRARAGRRRRTDDGHRHRDGPPIWKRPSAWPTATRSSTPPSACIRTMPRRPRPTPSRACAIWLAHPKVLAHRRDRPRLPLRFLAARRAARRLRSSSCEIAAERRKPIVIHTREAWDDTLSHAARALARPWRHHALLHRRRRSRPREALDLGFHLSFGGVLTFPKAEGVREAARITPADRLLVETDCPYLAPVPHRGKRNEPAFVVETARKLAEVRGDYAGDDRRMLPLATFARLCLRGRR